MARNVLEIDLSNCIGATKSTCFSPILVICGMYCISLSTLNLWDLIYVSS